MRIIDPTRVAALLNRRHALQLAKLELRNSGEVVEVKCGQATVTANPAIRDAMIGVIDAELADVTDKLAREGVTVD